jgi:predicted amidophosphoribosyltransferase
MNTRQGHDLHICPDCDRDLVYPVDWRQISRTDWEVLRRCPNCEWTDLGVHDQASVDRYDEVLDEGMHVIEHQLRRLQAQTMQHDVETFLAALEADAILPEDF